MNNYKLLDRQNSSKKNQSKIFHKTQDTAKIVIWIIFIKFNFKLHKFEIQWYKQKLQQILNLMQKESINLDLKHKIYKQYKIRTILFLKQKRK